MSLSPPLKITDPTNPWSSDQLHRKSFGLGLEQAVGSLPKPLCISVDGAWGSGKTSFLDMWQQHMANKGHKCVRFDAWQHDFCHDALLALVHDMIQSLGGLEHEKAQAVWKTTRSMAGRIGKQFLRDVATKGLKKISQDMLDVESLMEAALDDEKSDEALFASLTQDKAQMQGLRDSFKQLVEAKLGAHPNQLFIVIVDELDRCKPTFALELLEGIKHLFAVSERVVFVFGIDRQQLAHTVTGAYGQGFDGLSYLRRIIEIGFVLPEPPSLAQLPMSSARIMAGMTIGGGSDRSEFWEALVKSFRFTLRDIQQWMARLAMYKDRSQHIDFNLVSFMFALQQADPLLATQLMQYGVDASEARKTLHAKFKFEHPLLRHVQMPLVVANHLQPPTGWVDFPSPVLIQLMWYTNDPGLVEIEKNMDSFVGKETVQQWTSLSHAQTVHANLGTRSLNVFLSMGRECSRQKFAEWQADMSYALRSAYA